MVPAPATSGKGPSNCQVETDSGAASMLLLESGDGRLAIFSSVAAFGKECLITVVLEAHADAHAEATPKSPSDSTADRNEPTLNALPCFTEPSIAHGSCQTRPKLRESPMRGFWLADSEFLPRAIGRIFGTLVVHRVWPTSSSSVDFGPAREGARGRASTCSPRTRQAAKHRGFRSQVGARPAPPTPVGASPKS